MAKGTPVAVEAAATGGGGGCRLEGGSAIGGGGDGGGGAARRSYCSVCDDGGVPAASPLHEPVPTDASA